MWSLRHLTSPRTTQRLLTLLIVGLPLHAVIVTIFNFSNEQVDLIFRSWKEILLAVIVLLNLPWAFRNKIWQDKINQLILGFGALHIVYSLFMWEGMATAIGLRNNLGFLALYILARRFFSSRQTYLRYLEKLVLYCGLVVAASVFAEMIWPDLFAQLNLLKEFTRSEAIQDSDVIRYHGILSGPLQLGSYLVLPFAIALGKFIKTRSINYVIILTLFSVAIFLSYSRAALGAAVLVALVQLGLMFKHQIALKRALLVGCACLSAFAAIFILALNWRPLSLVVFHAEPEAALVKSSTVNHVVYAVDGIERIVAQPLGYGVGSAGPASFFAEKSFNPENHFLQIAIEVGVVGLALFMAILYLVARNLFDSPVLFSSLMALLAMNMLLHTWTDTATAWTAWILYGAHTALGASRLRSAK